jgi:hypothetical protein
MGYPNLSEYLDALQLDRAASLADPVLRGGSLGMHAPGRPIVHGGTYAFTFEVATGAGKFALRCFHRELDGLERRYCAIQRHLESRKGPYLVGFDFQPQGITTERGVHPVLRMDWVEGETLASYVAQHRHDASLLHRLRLSLRQLASHLLENDIGHGDIQPSNIIVQEDGQLRLIDYDGMFVPELATLLSAELGQRNFQHPDRRAYHFDTTLDAFAFMVLDVALQALCVRPDLWELTCSSEDAFLLRAADYVDPENSPAFGLLAEEAALEQRVRDLAAVCTQPFENIPTFEDFLAGCNTPDVAFDLTGDGGLGRRRIYLAPSRVLYAVDFAECCRHIGDRVELIGPVVAVSKGEAASDGRACLRIEFDQRSRDRTCLDIWPDTMARLDSVPDESWIGRWVSAVGLVEPVVRDETDRRYQKHLPMSITEPSQLQVLDEAEARFRLQAQGELVDRSRDRAGSVRTDRVTQQVTSRSAALPAADAPVVRLPVRPPMPVTVQPASIHPAEPGEIREPAPAQATAPAHGPAPGPAHARAPVPAAPRAVAPAPAARRRRWLLPAAGAAVVAVAAYLLLSADGDRNFPTPSPATAYEAPEPAVSDSATAPAGDASSSSAALEQRDASEPPTDEAENDVASVDLVSDQPLRPDTTRIDTVAGVLRVAAGPDGRCRRVVTLDGEAVEGLCEDRLELRHHATFGDRDVVVGFMRCASASAICNLDRPFWLELRAGSPPVLRQPLELVARPGSTAVDASNAGVEISLGAWNGERRRATLTPAGNVLVTRAPVPIQSLAARDCAVVAQSLEACAASRDCSSFARSARPIPASQWSQLARMYHESTGLDVGSYRALCVRSCELGLTPSAGFVRRNVCSGARRGQWPGGNPAGGLER